MQDVLPSSATAQLSSENMYFWQLENSNSLLQIKRFSIHLVEGTSCELLVESPNCIVQMILLQPGLVYLNAYRGMHSTSKGQFNVGEKNSFVALPEVQIHLFKASDCECWNCMCYFYLLARNYEMCNTLTVQILLLPITFSHPKKTENWQGKNNRRVARITPTVSNLSLIFKCLASLKLFYSVLVLIVAKLTVN
jgi:hypothetical protein